MSTEEAQRYPYWRGNLWMMPLSGLLCALAFAMSWPFLPLMVRGLGVQHDLETWVGNMMLVFYIIGCLINPLWGSLADHHGRKISVLRATIGMGIFMSIIPLAWSPLSFACLFMFVGLFNGSTSAANTLLVATIPPRRLGTALALTQTGGMVGRTVGPAAGAAIGVFITHYHWIFWISGGLMLAGGVLVVFWVHEIKQVVVGVWRPHLIGDFRELVAVPRMAELLLLCFLFSVLWSGNVTIVSIYALQLLADQPAGAGSEAFWVGAVAMGLAVSSLVALPFWGRILDRVDPGKVAVFSTALAAITHVPLLFLHTPMQLVVARVAFGLTSTAMQPALIRLLKDYAPRGMDARAISYGTSFQMIAMGLAPFCAGLMGPVLGLRSYFGLTIALTLGGLALWLRSGTPTAKAH